MGPGVLKQRPASDPMQTRWACCSCLASCHVECPQVHSAHIKGILADENSPGRLFTCRCTLFSTHSVVLFACLLLQYGLGGARYHKRLYLDTGVRNQANILFFEMFEAESRSAFWLPRLPPSRPSRHAHALSATPMPFARAHGVQCPRPCAPTFVSPNPITRKRLLQTTSSCHPQQPHSQ